MSSRYRIDINTLYTKLKSVIDLIQPGKLPKPDELDIYNMYVLTYDVILTGFIKPFLEGKIKLCKTPIFICNFAFINLKFVGGTPQIFFIPMLVFTSKFRSDIGVWVMEHFSYHVKFQKPVDKRYLTLKLLHETTHLSTLLANYELGLNEDLAYFIVASAYIIAKKGLEKLKQNR